MKISQLLLLCLCLACVTEPLSSAETFNNASVRKAQSDYKNAVSRAAKKYAAVLERALKNARQAENAAEVAAIEEELKNMGAANLPAPGSLEELSQQLIGTRWFSGPTGWTRFGENGNAVNHNGTKIAWKLLDSRTLIQQSEATSDIYLWIFNGNGRTADVHQFTKSNRRMTGTRE